MAGITEPRELLLHGLKDIYYVENALVKTLPSLSNEATDGELKRGLDQHLRETKQQVTKLDRVFKALGETPAGERCPGFDGIKREHDQFMQEERPSREMRDVFLTGAAARTEHYEIAAYTELISLARAIGERECAQLLDENLKQEKAALKKVESTGRRIARESAKNGRSSNGRARGGSRTSRRAPARSRTRSR